MTLLELLAFHEAGHAVMARHFGCRIAEVWINSGSGDGNTTFQTSGQVARLERALIALAGDRAEFLADLDGYDENTRDSIRETKDVEEAKGYIFQELVEQHPDWRVDKLDVRTEEEVPIYTKKAECILRDDL